MSFLLRPLLALFEYRLRHKAGHGHNDDRCHRGNDEIGDKIRLNDVPRSHQPHGGRNEHDGHDLNEKAGRVVHVAELDDAEHQAEKHQHKAVDARRNGQGQKIIQQLPNKRDDEDDAELLDIFHDFSSLCVLIFIVRRALSPVNRRTGGIPPRCAAFS